jgi:ATP-dependent Zn protease
MDREGIAVHEAGHALAALMFNHDVTFATILADKDSGGRVDFDDWDQAGTLEERTMVLLAGREALVLSGLLTDDARAGCARDLAHARAHVLVHCNGDEARADQLTSELRARTNALLAEHFPAVGEVSIELLKRLTLTGNELREIIAATELAAAGRASLSVCPAAGQSCGR